MFSPGAGCLCARRRLTGNARCPCGRGRHSVAQGAAAEGGRHPGRGAGAFADEGAKSGARGTARATGHRPVVRRRPQLPLRAGDDVQPRRGLPRSSPRPWVVAALRKGNPAPGKGGAPLFARAPRGGGMRGAALREGSPATGEVGRRRARGRPGGRGRYGEEGGGAEDGDSRKNRSGQKREAARGPRLRRGRRGRVRRRPRALRLAARARRDRAADREVAVVHGRVHGGLPGQRAGDVPGAAAGRRRGAAVRGLLRRQPRRRARAVGVPGLLALRPGPHRAARRRRVGLRGRHAAGHGAAVLGHPDPGLPRAGADRSRARRRPGRGAGRPTGVQGQGEGSRPTWTG